MDKTNEALHKAGELLPVAETFYSLQGEGYNTGKPAFFIRLSGCNVHCPFCDSKKTWNMEAAEWLTIAELTEKVKESGAENIVITGGEPLMHNLTPLCQALHSAGRKLWLETSASLPFSGRWDWVCISPKKSLPPLEANLAFADELKIIISTAEDLNELAEYEQAVPEYTQFYLQAEWDKRRELTPIIISHIKKHQNWRLSLQTHKWLDIE